MKQVLRGAHCHLFVLEYPSYSWYKKTDKERKREREKEREREREREIEIETETERDIETQRDRQRARERDGVYVPLQTESERDGVYVPLQTAEGTGEYLDRQTWRQTDIQKHMYIENQMDRHKLYKHCNLRHRGTGKKNPTM